MDLMDRIMVGAMVLALLLVSIAQGALRSQLADEVKELQKQVEALQEKEAPNENKNCICCQGR